MEAVEHEGRPRDTTQLLQVGGSEGTKVEPGRQKRRHAPQIDGQSLGSIDEIKAGALERMDGREVSSVHLGGEVTDSGLFALRLDQVDQDGLASTAHEIVAIGYQEIETRGGK